MTTLGRFFAKKSINRSDVSRKTGISKTRLSEFANNLNTQLKVKALYWRFLAVDEDPGELFKEVCKDL
jgi:putative transcriptional regulator